MGINLDLYRKVATSKDRVFTGKCDVNGRKINVGDVYCQKDIDDEEVDIKDVEKICIIN